MIDVQPVKQIKTAQAIKGHRRSTRCVGLAELMVRNPEVGGSVVL